MIHKWLILLCALYFAHYKSGLGVVGCVSVAIHADLQLFPMQNDYFLTSLNLLKAFRYLHCFVLIFHAAPFVLFDVSVLVCVAYFLHV